MCLEAMKQGILKWVEALVPLPQDPLPDPQHEGKHKHKEMWSRDENLPEA